MLASEPVQQVFEKVLETCKAVQAITPNVDGSNYEIEGQTPTLKDHKISNFKINLSPRKFGTLIRVDDHFYKKYNPVFIRTLVHKLREKISISVSNPIYQVQHVDYDSACTACREDNYLFVQFRSNDLCPSCFLGDFYGKLLLLNEYAQYYGGHKAYLAGGMFSNSQGGKIYLTEHYLIFAKGNKDPSKRWEIIIPLSSVDVEEWSVEESSRRKQITAAGGSIGGGGIGSGVIHETGKEHHLVIAYTDENGVPQQPRFGISSFRGKAIREWSQAVYSAVVSAKKKTQGNVVNTVSINDDKESDGDPLQILKLRLAKGEITLEEYEKTRKILE